MNVDLTADEDVVLCEYTSKGDGRQLLVGHLAERNALWALSAQLEKHLVTLNQADYVAAARGRVEEQGGPW
jgi:hypothetical protein